MARDAKVSEEMAKKFATEKETPYTRWVHAEGLEIQSAMYVPNLHTVELKPWARRGGKGVFLNHDASRTSNDAYVCEIPPGRELAPQRQLFEEMIYILDGRGSTTVWNEAGVKLTFEWKAGAIFAIPLNTMHQHFNGSGKEPARYLALKPWGFTYQVEDLVKTLEVQAAGGTQIDYQDQDPEIHQTFVSECAKRGVEVRLKF